MSSDFGNLGFDQYLASLEQGYKEIEAFTGPHPPEYPFTRGEYLANYIFAINTYDSEEDELFASWAVNVCEVISEKSNYEFIKDPERHRWYLIMCHMPFFAERIEWGSSIRGAWWAVHDPLKIDSCGLWHEGCQVDTHGVAFTPEGWMNFIKAVIAFHAAGQENIEVHP